MRERLVAAQLIALAAVLIAWLGLGVALVGQARRSRGRHRRRDAASLIGMALQGVGLALVFSVHSRWAAVRASETVLAAVAVLLSAAAVLLIGSALRTLGRQWSLAARVLEGHQLITAGPYGFVRHPIYTGFLGLLLATGAAASSLLATTAATAIYVAGTLIRISREDRLLREAFGTAYEAYARKVPALIPKVRSGDGRRAV